MSFIKKFFQKIKQFFVKEIPLKEQPETTVTVTRLPIRKKIVKIEKPKIKIKKEKKVRVEKRIPKTVVGFRCTLAWNYVVHHCYYSAKITYYTNDVNSYYKIKDDLRNRLIEEMEKEIQYPYSDWWFLDIYPNPNEEVTLTVIPKDVIGKTELKFELVKIGKRAKTKVKAK